MVVAKIVALICKPFDQLCAALIDKSRADRAMLLWLVLYALAWTLYASIARSSQDLHPDMVELLAWSRDLSLGYLKHPPLAAWLVWLWFSLFPLNDVSYYLLAMLMPTIALWIVWHLSADYLDIEKRIAGVALLMLVPFYNFHALKFNANTVLLPMWAATTLCFLRSYRTCSNTYGALAGIGAAACMLGKYWSAFLIAGLVLASLADSRRSTYFRSSAPWVTVIAGFALLGPHVAWLYQRDFELFEYAVATHVAHSLAGTTGKALFYLVGCAAYVAAPVLFVLVAARPYRAAIGDILWPPDGERRLATVGFWAPLLLPVIGALAAGIHLTPLWSMPAWTLLPVVLLSSTAVTIDPVNLRRLLAVAMALPVVMLIAAPGVAIGIHLAGVTPLTAHSRLLAAETERYWHQVTPQPLRYVGCRGAEAVAAYAADRPRALPRRSFSNDLIEDMPTDAYGWPRPAEGWSTRLARTGMALVCVDGEMDWLIGATKRAARNPESRRVEIEIGRNFLGISGAPQRYVIFIIPPAR
jgi:4-amino-4-deoxy-L-arabinose transferase-like glycosyltransferase